MIRNKIQIISVRAEDLLDGDVALLPSGRRMMWSLVTHEPAPSAEHGEGEVILRWITSIGLQAHMVFNRYEPVKIQLLKKVDDDGQELI